MGWDTALSIVSIAAGLTIGVVVLAAVGSIRRSVNEGTAKQAQQIRKLAENLATLNIQQQEAQTRIQALVEANRRLAEDVAALGERVADGDGARGHAGPARLLH